MADAHPILWVETKNDGHAITQLLDQFHIVLDKTTGPVLWRDKDGFQNLLESIAVQPKEDSTRPIGFVMDTDIGVDARWTQVRAKLLQVCHTVPETCPGSGFVAMTKHPTRRIGVWLLPDCLSSGEELEHLLWRMVPKTDALRSIAESSTEAAATKDRRFKAEDELKATVHCWLAWQASPGESFGHAIRKKCFEHDIPAAQAFVAWFRELYQEVLSPPPAGV